MIVAEDGSPTSASEESLLEMSDPRMPEVPMQFPYHTDVGFPTGLEEDEGRGEFADFEEFSGNCGGDDDDDDEKEIEIDRSYVEYWVTSPEGSGSVSDHGALLAAMDETKQSYYYEDERSPPTPGLPSTSLKKSYSFKKDKEMKLAKANEKQEVQARVDALPSHNTGRVKRLSKADTSTRFKERHVEAAPHRRRSHGSHTDRNPERPKRSVTEHRREMTVGGSSHRRATSSQQPQNHNHGLVTSKSLHNPRCSTLRQGSSGSPPCPPSPLAGRSTHSHRRSSSGGNHHQHAPKPSKHQRGSRSTTRHKSKSKSASSNSLHKRQSSHRGSSSSASQEHPFLHTNPPKEVSVGYDHLELSHSTADSTPISSSTTSPLAFIAPASDVVRAAAACASAAAASSAAAAALATTHPQDSSLASAMASAASAAAAAASAAAAVATAIAATNQ